MIYNRIRNKKQQQTKQLSLYANQNKEFIGISWELGLLPSGQVMLETRDL